MTPARIGFSTAPKKNFLSWAINTLTRSDASHCYFVFYDETFQCEMVMEAHWTFRLLPYALWRKTNKVVAEYEWRSVGGSYLMNAIRLAKDWLDEWYDVEGLLGMVPVVIAKNWFRKKLSNPLQSAKAHFCSEAVAQGLLLSGAPLQPVGLTVRQIDPSSTSPADLLTMCQDLSHLNPDVVQRYEPQD